MDSRKLAGLLVVGAALASQAVAADKEPQAFQVVPIGTVEREGGKTFLVLDEKYAKGLLGLDGFSHVVVLYWFDKNDTPQKRSMLQVRPREKADNPVTGVFACRSPVRPNLIGLSTCQIIAIEGNRIQVAQIDAFDHTPILDLKPFVPIDNPTQGIRVPDWAKRGKAPDATPGPKGEAP